MTSDENRPPRPHPARRKSSFSDALNKISNTTFNRRRTPSLLPRSTSNNVFPRSHLPTPSGIPRSTTFLTSLSDFNHQNVSRDVSHDAPVTGSRNRPAGEHKQDQRRRSLASQGMANYSDAMPSKLTKRRDSSVMIEQRGLMQPMLPPLPKSNTIAVLPTIHSSPRAANLSKPKRKSNVLETVSTQALAPAADSIGLQQPGPANFPVRKDSLGPFHARTTANLQQRDDGPSVSHSTPPTTNQRATESWNSDLSLPLPLHGAQRKMGSMQSSFAEDFTDPKSDFFYDEKVHELDFALQSGEKCSQTSDGARDEAGVDDPCLVRSRQPPTYWLGRYVSLSDSLRSAALPLPPSRTISPNPPFQITPARDTTSKPSPKRGKKASSGGKSTPAQACDHLHPMHDSNRRDKRVFALLRGMCVTEEARESLAMFAGMMADALEARKGAKSEAMKGIQKSISDSWGVKEKKGWLEGLMGKRKGSK